MSRGRAHEEMEFGSDSFLDVVANIVGILIILIVVAGIKAGTSPVTAERIAEYVRNHGPKAPAGPAESPGPGRPQLIPISPDVKRKNESLRAELAALETDSRNEAAQLAHTDQRQGDVERQIDEGNKAIQAAAAELARRERELADAKSRLEQKKTGLLQLEVDVKQAKAAKPPLKIIEHKLTPLSREIRGKELHFRLQGNKVVYLPIEELMSRLKPQITQHRQRLLREGIQEGQVGPVAGFRMDYIVSVQHLSVLDEIRSGASMTIGVSEWRLVPEPDLDSEGPDEALKDGSEFLRTLRISDPETTITFWVYPDSFEIYRRLQEFAHHENFTVAARPLPFNVPIAGSPRGTRSSGQ